jgi:hypothetical protein
LHAFFSFLAFFLSHRFRAGIIHIIASHAATAGEAQTDLDECGRVPQRKRR